jgi:hypothetical protein
MRHPERRTLAIAAASGGIMVLAACLAPAASASPAGYERVPCDTAALASAISSAANGDTLALAAGCTYQTSATLPAISTSLAIIGHGATLQYTGPLYPGSNILAVQDGVTVHISSLNFTGGGGFYGSGGAIQNGGNLTIDGGTCLRRDCIMSNTPVNCFNVPGCKG